MKDGQAGRCSHNRRRAVQGPWDTSNTSNVSALRHAYRAVLDDPGVPTVALLSLSIPEPYRSPKPCRFSTVGQDGLNQLTRQRTGYSDVANSRVQRHSPERRKFPQRVTAAGPDTSPANTAQLGPGQSARVRPTRVGSPRVRSAGVRSPGLGRVSCGKVGRVLVTWVWLDNWVHWLRQFELNQLRLGQLGGGVHRSQVIRGQVSRD